MSDAETPQTNEDASTLSDPAPVAPPLVNTAEDNATESDSPALDQPASDEQDAPPVAPALVNSAEDDEPGPGVTVNQAATGPRRAGAPLGIPKRDPAPPAAESSEPDSPPVAPVPVNEAEDDLDDDPTLATTPKPGMAADNDSPPVAPVPVNAAEEDEDETPSAPAAQATQAPAPKPSIGDSAPAVGDSAPAVGDSAPAAGSVGPAEAAEPKGPSDAGKIIGGSITEISPEEVVVRLDDGRTGVIQRRNFDDAGTDPTTVYNIGDRAEGAVLVREDPQARVVLSRAWALKKAAWDKLAALSESGDTLSATVSGTSKRGVVVDVGVRGFVPASHLELQPPKNLKDYIGQTFEFKVLELDVAKERLVLSRRSLLLREQRKATHDALTSLTVGETRTGSVASIVEYGAFVDVGGVTGLVHMSEMSWGRVRKPADLVKVGDEVEVKVLDVKVKKRRVSLSMRQISPDPLESVPVGEVVSGPVTRLVDFGAFVDVGAGEGLVHLSELSEYRVFTPEEVVTPGEVVRVKILSVDKKRRRIELSIRQAVSTDFG